MQLPIIENPWIQTYQIRNFELGILQEKKPWIYGKYINCCCKKNSFSHCINSHGRFFSLENAMLIQKFKFDRSIFDIGILDFVEFTKNLVDCQWYVMGEFDEYHITCKEAYHLYHFRHWALVYGYDEQSELFYSVGYVKGGKYQKYTMSFDEFVNAINVNFDKVKEKYIKKNINRIELYAVKINPEYEFKFDLCDVYIGITDYLHSTDSYERDAEKSYGIECEQKFIEYILDTSKSRRSIDVRFSRLFMELKDIMVHRINYLVSVKVVSSDLVAQYENIAKKQTTVHLLCIKYNITRDDSILLRITSIIKEIIAMEQEVLPKVCNEIYTEIKNEWKERYY